MLTGLFVISGCLFIKAYEEYGVNLRELAVVHARKISVINQIKKFEKKKRILGRLNDFTKKVNQFGLTEDNYDKFSVNLKHKRLSFRELGKILAQTENSCLYYFKPLSLSIKPICAGGCNSGSLPPSVGGVSTGGGSDKAFPSNSDAREIKRPAFSASAGDGLTNRKSRGDVILNLKGVFLVRKGGGDG